MAGEERAESSDPGRAAKQPVCKEMQPVYRFMNRTSLIFHYLLACVLNFFIEVISRHSLFEAWDYMVGTPKVFLFNAFLIFATFFICVHGKAVVYLPGSCLVCSGCF